MSRWIPASSLCFCSLLLFWGCASTSDVASLPACTAAWEGSIEQARQVSEWDQPPELIGGLSTYMRRVRRTSARRPGEAFRGKLGFVVDEMGCVREPSLVAFSSTSGSSEKVAQPFIKAIEASRFHPAVKDGKRVAVWLEMPFHQNSASRRRP